MIFLFEELICIFSPSSNNYIFKNIRISDVISKYLILKFCIFNVYFFYSFDTRRLYKNSINKVALVIIDGIRYDFFTEPEHNMYMPFSTDLIKQNQSCLFRTKAKAPTVTMPRIKVQ